MYMSPKAQQGVSRWIQKLKWTCIEMIHMSPLDREVYEIDELQNAGSNWRRDSPQSVHHLEMAGHVFLYDDLAAATSINISDQSVP